MRHSYMVPVRSPSTKQLAGDLVRTIICSDVSYEVALNALEEAEEMLLGTTKPVSFDFPQRDD